MALRELVFLGKSTALASGTDHVTDAVYFKMSTLSSADEAETFIRITSTSNSDAGLVAKVKRIAPDTGKIYFDPPAGAAIVSGTTYELWRHGIRPDMVDRARDRALANRVSLWLLKPLSLLSDVSGWLANATETVTQTAMAFPSEFYPFSSLINNNGVANGHANSESFYPRPLQRHWVFGRVSARTGTATLRVRDITNGADIALQAEAGSAASFIGRGWQWFLYSFTVPTGCYEVQLWPGGAATTVVAEWAGIGILNEYDSEIGLPARVTSEHDIGYVYGYTISMSAPQLDGDRQTFDNLNRERAGAGARIRFPSPPGRSGGPVYYQERHRYAALQTDYLTAVQREIGDAATTDCPLLYVEAATVCTLLEGMVTTRPELKPLLLTAEMDLAAWEREWGADPIIVEEPRNQGRRPRLMRL